MKFETATEKINTIINEVKKAIVGKDEVLKYVLSGILANGHILFEDLPGLGKTLMIRTFSQAMGLNFSRIQFTPDLLPADISGVSVFNMSSNQFEFREGPVFTNLLLADEINRATPKTQSALLEAMQERTVTVDGNSYKLDSPFIVLATQNPIEYEGTFTLPEAQLDRFLMKLNVGYPSKKDEIQIVKNRVERKKEEFDIDTVVSKQDILDLQFLVENIHVSDPIVEYVVSIVEKTRNHSQIAVGASPRGSLGLIQAAKAWALIQGRDFVNPQDIQDVLIPVLGHRVILRSGDIISGVTSETILTEIYHRIPAPRIQ